MYIYIYVFLGLWVSRNVKMVTTPSARLCPPALECPVHHSHLAARHSFPLGDRSKQGFDLAASGGCA